jgi:zinc transporter ZupT
VVGLLCVVQLGPHAIEHGGWAAVGAGGVGIGLPLVLHRVGASSRWAAMGFVLLAGHAALDGAMLAVAGENLGPSLALAIVAHRVPVGVGVYHFALRTANRGARPGWQVAWAAIGILTVVTMCGFWVGTGASPYVSDPLRGMVEGLIVGILLHAVLAPTTEVPSHE